MLYFCCSCLVTKLCLTLCDPTDCSPPGSSVHETSQARVLEWGAIAFSEKEVYQVLKVTSKTILSRTHGVSLVVQW